MPPTPIKKQKRKSPAPRPSRADTSTACSDKASEIAVYYGFTEVETPEITRADLEQARGVVEGDLKTRDPECTLSVCPEEKIAVLRTYAEKKFERNPQPVMLFFDGALSAGAGKRKTPKEKHFDLEIIGTGKSIAEAILIKTSVEILKEEGYPDLFVNVNSVGDRDSILKFAKDLTAYYRKNLNILPTHCKQLFKKDVFECLDCKNEKCRIVKEDAPKSVSYLSEQSRTHFKEVLEYLEMLEIPYQMHPFLIGHRSFCTQTLFEIREGKEAGNPHPAGQPLALGVRYNNLARRIGFKRDLPGIGVRLAYKALKKETRSSARPLKIKKPKVYFVQLGFDAKLKCLKVLEMLRQEKIPLAQSLARDQLQSQLAVAESQKIPYMMIMGQKEAMDDSVILRNMATRSQETIPIKELPKYLRKLKD